MANHQNFFATTLTSNVNAGDTTTPLNSIPSIEAPFYLTFDATSVNGHPEVVLVTSKTATNVNHAALQYAHTTSEVVKHAIVAEEANTLYNQANGGWQGFNGTHTFVSADGSTGVLNSDQDETGNLSVGMRYKYQQDQALTAYWSMDASSASQVGSFNGTDTAVTYTAGKFSNAATFNGTTSKIVIADNASLKPTGEFTIGCWFKKTGAGTLKTIFQSYSANTNVAGFRLEVETTNTLRFVIGKNTGTTSGTDYLDFKGTTNVADNAHHYAVVSFRNNYVQVYVDGKLEISGYCITPAYAATNYVRVGCNNSSGTDGQFWDGQIDDLFLINGYALDEKTIKAKYDAQTAQGTGNITVDKYALITAVGAYSAPNTPITVWGGTDYSLANATISSPYYATVSQPFGFPKQAEKWTVEFSNSVNVTQSSPVQNTWYNLATATLSVPIGAWNLSYQVNLQGSVTLSVSGGPYYATLSTANNTESDSSFTSSAYTAGANGALNIIILANRNKQISLNTKTSYYLNTRTTAATQAAINNRGDLGLTIIRATSTLL